MSELQEAISDETLEEQWRSLAIEERPTLFRQLSSAQASEFFLGLSSADQAQLVLHLSRAEGRIWTRLLPPDDVADLLQAAPLEERPALEAMLDENKRREVAALLLYEEDVAGGLMSPRFARVRPDVAVEVAIRYLRRQTQNNLATFYYAYVLDREQRLSGVVSFRELFAAQGDVPVEEIMHTDVVSVTETTDQETVARLIAQHNLMAVPVVDDEGRMRGIVTVDDIVDVVQEEATEDIQKLGGSEALGAPYLQVSLPQMIRKRGGWLSVLFLGEMLTATAMTRFEDELAKAVVLAMFVPLIISSGGNSGSQASTLVVRALALEELRLRDWGKVLGRELTSGLTLGVLLGLVGMLRVILWQDLGFVDYGEHYVGLGLTVGISLVGVVAFGTLVGSMLPFLLRKLGFDPATSSAPFVATLVDVTGLVIYFVVAAAILSGTLLP